MAQATTNANIDFAVGDAGDDATKFRLYNALTGGTLLLDDDLANNPSALVANQFYRVEAGDITLVQPIGTDGFTESMARRGVEGYIDIEVFIEFLSASNTVLTDTRVRIAEATWDVT